MYKEAVLIASTTVFLFQQYLSYRQLRRLYTVTKRPVEIEPILGKDDFEKTRSYSIDRGLFGFVVAFKSMALHLAMIYFFDGYAVLWNWSAELLQRYYFGSEHVVMAQDWKSIEILHSLVFLTVYSVVESIIQLPLSLYSTFVIEERHGFNKQTLRLFFTDFVKTMALSAVIGYPCIAGFLWVINRTGDQFYFYVWLFVFALQIFLMTIYPTWIQPLFNKVEPLPEGELKQQIEQLAASVSFPLTKLFVIDGSKRSSHSNAYFYGFHKNKRIVLFDTLIEQVKSTGDILAVLAHEIGHWYHSHLPRTLALTQLISFGMFYLFSFANKNETLYRDFGFGNTEQTSAYIPTLISFLLFSELYAPIDFLTSVLMNVISRMHEFQADRFAKSLNMEQELVSALLKISVENKGMMWPDELYSTFNHSHPPVIERIKALGVKVDHKKHN